MKIIETSIKGVFEIEPRIFKDDRGYFFESYNQNNLKIFGINNIFIQDNESYSSYGVVRGLHAQNGEYAQAKLVRVISGKVLDIVVDIRENSPTKNQYLSFELSEENKKQILIPRGCLHGFVVLSETARFLYKCDNIYHKDSEIGVHPLDVSLNIDWKVSKEKLIISEKDQQLGSLENATYYRS